MKDLGRIIDAADGNGIFAWQGRKYVSRAAAEKYVGTLETILRREITADEMEAPYGVHQQSWLRLGSGENARDDLWLPPMKADDQAPSLSIYDRPDVAPLTRRVERRSAREEIYDQGRAAERAGWSQDILDRVDAEERAKLLPQVQSLYDQIRLDPESDLQSVRDARRMYVCAQTPHANQDYAKGEFVRLSNAVTEQRRVKRDQLQRELDDAQARLDAERALLQGQQ